MSELLGIARFKFHDGKVEEFKRLSAQAMEIVRTKDSGTMQYDIYLNDDESETLKAIATAGAEVSAQDVPTGTRVPMADFVA